ncbi:DedA family protein [Bartonella sp. HY761]|uniref:DedA family protein n=1 Tax=Bartonella sp. HY761 TaxID=2979330 RepID=UPI00220ECAEA|nr:DedA family protein [Bartonella sp. HY761]UXN07174.1 DedA family protein [Bartonella sp. HY761]
MHAIEIWLEACIQHYGIFAYFFILYFESLGLPLPGESGLVVGSLLAAAGKLSLPGLLVACFLGSVLGDCTGYAIGHFGGKKLLLRYGYLIKLTPERLDKFENQLNQKGFFFVATARFIVIARQLNGIIAGSGGMAFHKFFIANIIGSAAWTLVWGAGPYIVKVFFS